MALTPGTRIGVFQLIDLIGRGGMGEVFRARDTKLDRDVAIKILPEAFAHDTERLARFQREAKTLASLNHPNIAAIYGLEESEGITALVMELVEGDDLSQRITRGAIPLDEALPIAKQIAEALEVAHEQGIIHRDLKPANIKVRPDGTVKVLDFGLAKAMEPAAGSSPSMSMSPTITTPAMTQAGMILGTAAYMSPEQARGKAVDKRADIWAFGAVLFEMLTGRRAFPGEDLTDTLAAVVKLDPKWDALAADAPARVRQVLRACLQKDPKQRMGDVQSVRLALQGAFETTASQTMVVRSWTPRRERWLWAGALVAVAIVTAGAARFLIPSPALPAPIRFTVSPPADKRLTTSVGTNVALSPDGRYVVLPIIDPAGQVTLFVRALDDDSLRELPGTSGANLPFWAPDNRGIAFFANGQLKRTDRDGAPVQTVCDALAAQGGAWAPDGTIVVGAAAGPLRRVPASGGRLVEMTTLDQSLKESSHRHPTILPDGRHFLYLAASAQPGGSVYAGSLDDDSKTLLVASDSNADYLDGYLLFARGGTLLAQAFDASSLQVSGNPVALVRNIWFNPTVARASFSGAGKGTLVFRVAVPSAPTQLTYLDRSGREIGKVGEPADQTNLELSPDGTRLVLSIFDPVKQTRDLWIQDLRKSVRTRFTFGPNEEFAGVWSPDGQRLVFSSVRTDVLDLLSQAADGSGTEELLVESMDNKYPSSWSHDGQLLLFNNGNARSRTGNDLWVLPMGQKQKPRVFLGGTFNETGGTFSPDGRWVSYMSNESGRSEIYVVPYPGPGGKWQVSAGGGAGARWNPNGRELLYLTNNATAIMSVAVDGNGTAFQAATPQKLFEARFRNENYRGYGIGSAFVITPDGQRILANLQTNEPTAPDAVTIVTNWTSLLRQ